VSTFSGKNQSDFLCGLEVTHIIPIKSKVLAAGLQIGDVICGVDGQQFDDAMGLVIAIDHPEDRVLTLSIVRGTDEFEVSVEILGQLDPD
jgi:S1-C subfamily serine protease